MFSCLQNIHQYMSYFHSLIATSPGLEDSWPAWVMEAYQLQIQSLLSRLRNNADISETLTCLNHLLTSQHDSGCELYSFCSDFTSAHKFFMSGPYESLLYRLLDVMSDVTIYKVSSKLISAAFTGGRLDVSFEVSGLKNRTVLHINNALDTCKPTFKICAFRGYITQKHSPHQARLYSPQFARHIKLSHNERPKYMLFCKSGSCEVLHHSISRCSIAYLTISCYDFGNVHLSY